MKALADENIELSSVHGFGQWLDAARIWRSWVECMLDPLGNAVRRMTEANDAVRDKGGEIFQGNSQCVLAGAFIAVGQFENALNAANVALDHVKRTGECWWEAEGHRLRGEALRMTGEGPSVVEDCFNRALEVACYQQARSLVLRAATSIAHLWKDQGKREQAREVLMSVYDWFSEGFDTADMKEAKALLDALS